MDAGMLANLLNAGMAGASPIGGMLEDS